MQVLKTENVYHAHIRLFEKYVHILTF